MVFQSYALFPHMTVERNIDFGLRLAKVPVSGRRARVKAAAEILHLEKLLHRKPAALSGGQRQRVAIGRSIVRSPKVFLFDEPLSNLDAALRNQMRVELADLHKRLGATMIYVTHDQVEAMTLADQIVVMNAGRIEQIGAPMDLYNLLRTEFVATFIGSPRMNLLSGAPATDLGGATIGVRPEDFEIDPVSGRWTGIVRVIERLGSESILHINADVGEILLRISGATPIETGAEVRFSPKQDGIHRFDHLGQRIQ